MNSSSATAEKEEATLLGGCKHKSLSTSNVSAKLFAICLWYLVQTIRVIRRTWSCLRYVLKTLCHSGSIYYCILLGLFLRKIQLVWLWLDGRFPPLTQSYVSSTTTIKVAKIAVAFLHLPTLGPLTRKLDFINWPSLFETSWRRSFAWLSLHFTVSVYVDAMGLNNL